MRSSYNVKYCEYLIYYIIYMSDGLKGCGGCALAVVIVFMVTIGTSILGSALGVINLPFFNFGKKVDVNYGIIETTYDTDYCLANYEWFKDTAAGIEAKDVQISTQQGSLDEFRKNAGPRENWTFEDKQFEADLVSKVNGLKNIRATLVGQYNSRSEQLNRVACKELPLFFNL